MRIILKAWQKHRALDPSLASIIQLDFYSFLDAELTDHYNDELNALALRLLPLCRCVLLYLRLLRGSVGCRSPPSDLDHSKIQIETEDNAMDGNHPKRRKDKYNPYTIGTTEDGRHLNNTPMLSEKNRVIKMLSIRTKAQYSSVGINSR